MNINGISIYFPTLPSSPANVEERIHEKVWHDFVKLELPVSLPGLLKKMCDQPDDNYAAREFRDAFIKAFNLVAAPVVPPPPPTPVVLLNHVEAALVRGGSKLTAIKMLRARVAEERASRPPVFDEPATLGLKDAKDACDAYQSQWEKETGQVPARPI